MALVTTRRVRRGEPCPVCGRATWCLLANSGRYVVCMRTESERPARNSMGGWVHRWNGETCEPAIQPQQTNANSRPGTLASPAHLDRVFRCIMGACWPLREIHRDALLERGFSPEAIQYRRYA